MSRQDSWSTSAPAKVILFGEHAVNRAQPALSAAVEPRTFCTVAARRDDAFVLRAGERRAAFARAALAARRDMVGAARAAGDVAAIAALARGDFFAPTSYVLACFLERHDLPGLDIAWRSDIPVGSGLGSGAAAAASLVLALARAAGVDLSPHDRAHLAWQGDIVAHGGIASGLDSAAATLGGLVRYTVAGGPAAAPAAPAATPLTVVVGDTRIRATTVEVNGRVRAWLDAHPEGGALFPAIATLTERALDALASGDLARLGGLMDENEAILERIGVSCPELERLNKAARDAGALGAKLSGSGGGGIMLALTTPRGQSAVAAAIEAAGGRALSTTAGVDGARDEGD